MQNDPVRTAKQHAFRYWYVDGLAEIGLGLICIILGLYFYAQATAAPGSLLSTVIDAGLILVVIGGALLSNRLVARAKAYITYPRTGYVAFQRPTRSRRWIGAVIAAGIGMAISALLANTPASLDWMTAITGFIFAIILVIMGLRTDLLRFYGLAVLCLGSGLGLSLSSLGSTLGLAAFYALIGLFLGFSGGLTLLRYLRTTEVGGETGI